jgi:hypothetical protein
MSLSRHQMTATFTAVSPSLVPRWDGGESLAARCVISLLWMGMGNIGNIFRPFYIPTTLDRSMPGVRASRSRTTVRQRKQTTALFVLPSPFPVPRLGNAVAVGRRLSCGRFVRVCSVLIMQTTASLPVDSQWARSTFRMYHCPSSYQLMSRRSQTTALQCFHMHQSSWR